MYIDDFYGSGKDLFVVPDSMSAWEGIMNSHKKTGKASKTDESQITIKLNKGFRDVVNLLESIGWTGLTEKEYTVIEKAQLAYDKLTKRMEYLYGQAGELQSLRGDDKSGVDEQVMDWILKLRNGIRDLQSKDERFKSEIAIGKLKENKIEDTYKNLEKAWARITKTVDEHKEDESEYELVINAIKWHKVSESTVKKYDDEDHLDELAKFELSDRHKSSPEIGRPQHEHLDGGKKGMAFTYKKEDDGSKTPIVYDYASGRSNSGTGNSYNWKNGDNSSGPPKVPSNAL